MEPIPIGNPEYYEVVQIEDKFYIKRLRTAFSNTPYIYKKRPFNAKEEAEQAIVEYHEYSKRLREKAEASRIRAKKKEPFGWPKGENTSQRRVIRKGEFPGQHLG